jgi:hypothetical protein
VTSGSPVSVSGCILKTFSTQKISKNNSPRKPPSFLESINSGEQS